MTEDWEALKDAEDLAYFRAELAEVSPGNYPLEEKMRDLEDMLVRDRERDARGLREARRGNPDDVSRQTWRIRLPRPGPVAPHAHGWPAATGDAHVLANQSFLNFHRRHRSDR